MLNKRNSARPLDPASVAFVERMGLVMEGEGHAKIAGRMMALLLLTEDDASLDRLAQQLGVSKPSVSVNARLLEEKGVIERVGRAGDRRDYYRIADDIVGRTLELRVAKLRRLQKTVAEARLSIKHPNPTVSARLAAYETACDYVAGHTESALADLRLRGRRGAVAARRAAVRRSNGANSPTRGAARGRSAR